MKSRLHTRIMTMIRAPLLHFWLIGASLYVLYGFFGQAADETPDPTITAAEITWLETSWQKRWNRAPTPDERRGLIEGYVRETILYREALAMGLDKDDTVIRRRLAQKLEFLAQDLVALTPPSDEDLQTYFDQHQARYQEPVRFTFTQVFIDPDQRGDATLDDAKAIKATLMAQSDATANAGALGDAFMLQTYYPEEAQADIQKLFGSGFAASVAELSPGQWHGPVLSGYGVHLVYVHNRFEPPVPVFTEVRERVVRDWEDDKRESLNEQYYASLRARYPVVIEDDAAGDRLSLLKKEQTP